MTNQPSPAKTNKGGRPVLATGRKEHIIRFRANEAELEQLAMMEKALGINRTTLIRKRLFEGSAQQLLNARAVLKRLDAVGAELGRAGNNINQLARHANTLKLRGQLSEPVMTEFILLFREYARVRQDTEGSLRAIIRMIRP